MGQPEKIKSRSKKCTICYIVTIIILAALAIGFLAAFVKERNKTVTLPEDPDTTLPATSTDIEPSVGSTQLTTGTSSLPSPTPTSPATELRLPRSILPTHYDLEVEPNHETDVFTGRVVIHLNATESTDVIKVHSYLLNVTVDELRDESNGDVAIGSVTYDKQRQYHVIELKSPLSVGSYQLSMSFSGSLVGKIIGFYKANYTIDNQIRQFSATKFEPTYARQAFPCFDEPNIKATFSVTVIHNKALNAISNGAQVERTEVDDNRAKTMFSKTVPMSTYLVAFVVSEFQFTEDSTVRGKTVRVFSRPDQVDRTKYALSTAIKVLEYLENFFQFDYPMEKLDLVALPVFVSGAMENWGLVTFKEQYLLYDPQTSSTGEKKRVAAVIGHELTHQWFGNVVTMDWWDDLWLNEGFASYIEYRAENATEPEWKIDRFFLNDDMHGVMRLDAMDSSHPIIQPVEDPNQITAIFDSISYSKGSAVLRMLDFAIGGDVFRDGIINYINAHEFGNAKTQNLWESIQTAVDDKPGLVTDVTEFMDQWTKVKGFPVVTVKRQSDKSFLVSQQKFLLNSEDTDAKDTTVWPVFLTFRHESGTGNFYLTKNEDTINLDSETSWIKFNNDDTGFFLVNYAEEDWKVLIELLKNSPDQLSPEDRANLIFDASMLAEGGHISYTLLFDLLSYVKSETDLIPWMAAQSALNRLDGKLSTADAGLAMKQLIKDLTQSVYTSLGWDAVSVKAADNTFQQNLLRTRIISLSCAAGNKDCLNEALRQFRLFLSTGQPISADLRDNAYKYGMQESGSTDDWLRLLDLWRTEISAGEKTKLLSALTSVSNAQLLSKLIALTNDQSVVNDQDFFTVLTSVSSNTLIGQQLVWNYLRDNWDYLVGRFTLNDRRLGGFVSSVCSSFNTRTQLKEMQDFFAAHPESGAGETARKQALERVENNIEWLTTNKDSVGQWLDLNSQMSNPWLNWRLDSQVMPKNYDLQWNIDLSTDTFSGQVIIDVEVQRPISSFIVHQKGLDITVSKAYSNAMSEDQLISGQKSGFAYNPNEFWVIPTDTTIRAGDYVLYLEFKGNLSTGLNGLYKSVYTDSNGVDKSLATTQFESTYARMAFPCFDEPQMKATFNITVTNGQEFTALSNMPGTEDSVDGKKVTNFETSVRMATYLVALVVSDFQCTKSSEDPRVQMCGLPGTEDRLKYALDKTPGILKYFERDYFDIDYPLPKLDNIAIPDFGMGAMENWGLVTYREVYLYYNEKESTTQNQMRVCSIVAHELAHMWFGNLVTMKWWDDLWLNEGFATFMSYKAVTAVEPDWRYDELFITGEHARVFDADSTPNTHPILTSVQDADDISAAFDGITYGKGACIIRMLENALGEKNFRAGIKNYLNKYKFQNTLTQDLWTELTEAHPEKLNVSQIMDSWVRRKGFPVVTISRGSNSTTLSQELFLKDSAKSESTYTWTIPVTYKVLNSTDGVISTVWLDNSTMKIDAEDLPTDELIKFNVDQMGLYIVNYPTDDWKKWSQLLQEDPKQISAIDRSSLVNDAFYLARSGRLDYTLALNLSQYLSKEDALVPWTTAQSMFSNIKSLIQSDAGIAFNHYITELVAEQYKSLGWDDSKGDAQTRRLRSLILGMACSHGMPDCLEKAADQFQQWRTGTAVAPNLLDLVLKYGIRQSTGRDDFDFLLEKYHNSNSAQEKLQFLQGLTSTTNVELITQLLNNATDDEFVRQHDFFTFLTNIAKNSQTGATMVWKYFRDNYEKIVERFTINSSHLGRMVYTLSTLFTTEDQKQEVLDFFKQYPRAGAGKLDREKALEVLDTNIKWQNNYKSKVIEWVTNQCPNTTCPWIVYRLNPQVIPVQYYLTIQVNTTTNAFNGSVDIEVDAKTDIEYFIVHTNDILQVTKSQVFVNGTDEEVEVKQTFRYSPLQFFVVRMAKKLTPNAYKLIFEFNSNLILSGLSGLYKSTYKLGNETIGLAASQFQSTSARKAFPSFDEPSFKSQFDVTLIHDNFNNLTISNMPISEDLADQPMPGWTTTRYERTVPMVSYLLAMLVSDFVCLEDTKSGLSYDVRVCASRAKSYKLDYALEVTPKIFQAFESYLDFPYQLPKSDLIAIPDFSAGAMENWGLVKFRETALLWTEDEDMSSNKMSVAAIIAHELAHMWFGNLLTCHFWGDLWLNEGFASFMEYHATNASEPDWDYWHTFVYNDLAGAVSADSVATSAPIVRQILKPSDMSYSSAIVYNKGATVIRMMEFAMGADNFITGIRQYLKKNQYKTVVTKNLWDSLDETFPHEELDTDIYSLMDSWTMKAGFPYINITRTGTDGNQFIIDQERFLQTGQRPTEETVWSIPLSFYTSSDLQDYNIVIVNQTTQTITIPGVTAVSYIKFNVDYRGMYFVNYPEEDWNRWTTALVENKDGIVDKLTPSDRAEFIVDSFYLAKAHIIPLLTPYKLTKFIQHDDHFIPWSQFNSHFNNRYRLSQTKYKESLNKYLSFVTSKQYDTLGWDDTNGNVITKRLRALVLDISCANGYEKCLEDAYKEFQKWKSGQQKLRPNLRTVTLNYGMRQSSDEQDFEYVWTTYLENNSTIKSSFLAALTLSRNQSLLQSLLSRSLDDRLVSNANFVSLMQSMSANSDGLSIVWQFFTDNYAMLSRKLTASQLSSVFGDICDYFVDNDKKTQVETFLQKYPTTGLTESARVSGLKKIEDNIEWIGNDGQTIGQWLEEESSKLNVTVRH